MKDKMKWSGYYTFEIIDELTGKIISKTKHNVVVQNFYTSVFKFLNQSTDLPASTI